MRKVGDGEKKRKEKNYAYCATNVIASRPPERRSTGTPHASANMYQPPSMFETREIKQKQSGAFFLGHPVGSCERLEQIPTIVGTFVQATFVLVTFVHISNIYHLPNFDPIFGTQYFLRPKSIYQKKCRSQFH